MKRAGIYTLRVICFLLLLGVSSPAFSQHTKEVLRLVKEGNFRALEAYIKINATRLHTMEWVIKRTVVDSFQEAVLRVSEMLPAPAGAIASPISNLEVKMLSGTNRLVYYSYSGSTTEYLGKDKFSITNELADNFMNKPVYWQFQQSFRQVYAADVKWTDLFLTDIEFGDNCGFAGMSPGQMVRLQSVLAQKEADSIRSWLQSANTETQLYAIVGLRIMQLYGYRLTAAEKRMVASVRTKKGKVNTCSGCMVSEESPGEVVKRIEEGEFDYLKKKRE